MSEIEDPNAQVVNIDINEILDDERICLQVLAKNNWYLRDRALIEPLSCNYSRQWIQWRLKKLLQKRLVRRRRMGYNCCGDFWEYQIINAGRAALQQIIEQSDGSLILGIPEQGFLTSKPIPTSQ